MKTYDQPSLDLDHVPPYALQLSRIGAIYPTDDPTVYTTCGSRVTLKFHEGSLTMSEPGELGNYYGRAIAEKYLKDFLTQRGYAV